LSDQAITLAALHLHPVKSCAALSPREALIVETGLDLDRAWMVVDRDGEMLTQRAHPRLALIRPTLRLDELVLRAPGMLALHLSLDVVAARTRVRIWGDIVRAYEMGALADQWISDYLGHRAQIVRFDPEQQRLSERRWTGAIEAENAFADGFPLLVVGNASVAELNRRLAERGAPPVGIERFRPNLVLDGLPAFDEDHVDELRFDTADGPIRFKLVKPCVRCTIPNVDPATGEVGAEPGATLATFRADPRMDGGITFGMNAIVLDGVDRVLRAGMSGRATLTF
jgi:uncharacterized protein YcbX